MSRIEYEDRTTETPLDVANRRIADAAAMLARASVSLTGGDAGIAISALAVALGQLVGSAEAPLDEVLALVARNREMARAFTLSRKADA